MGIRFYCQACEKRLNVKGFLAGKRGVCPHCGAKVDIPWESQAKSQRGTATSAAPRSVAPASVPTRPREVQPAHANGALNGHEFAGATILDAPGPTVLPAQQQAIPAEPVRVTAVPVATPVAAPSVPPPPAGPVDPIAEAPNAVWYVRPPSGGQYGPASGEIMRKWIAEGRVSADSLIWREGWPEWKSASSQFPEMAGATAPRGGATPAYLGQPSLGGPIESPTSRAIPRRKSNHTFAIVMVVVLTLASLALVVGLVVAIQLGSA